MVNVDGIMMQYLQSLGFGGRLAASGVASSMTHFLCALCAVFCFQQVGRSETINWFCDPLTTNLTSADLPMDGSFRFELGVFTSGFVPTSANTSQWAAHWAPAQRAVYSATNRFFTGQFTVSSNAAPFTVNAKAYIWGFSGSGASAEWILMRANFWNWPAPNPINPFGVDWYVPDATEVIVGQVNTSGSPFLMRSAPITGSQLPTTTWAQWTQEELSGQPLNGPLDDPDKDGVSNLMEFVFGKSPRNSDNGPLLMTSMFTLNSDQFLQVTLNRRSDHPATLVVEVSDNLVTWNSGPAHTTIIQDNPSALIVRDLTPWSPTHPSRFMRLKATLP